MREGKCSKLNSFPFLLFRTVKGKCSMLNRFPILSFSAMNWVQFGLNYLSLSFLIQLLDLYCFYWDFDYFSYNSMWKEPFFHVPPELPGDHTICLSAFLLSFSCPEAAWFFLSQTRFLGALFLVVTYTCCIVVISSPNFLASVSSALAGSSWPPRAQFSQLSPPLWLAVSVWGRSFVMAKC